MLLEESSSRDGTYAITAVTYGRRSLFQVERNAQLFIETLAHYKREGKYKLHAFVVMPDHVHILLTPETVALERAVGLIKGGFSHRLASTCLCGKPDIATGDAETRKISLRKSTTFT